MALRGDLQQQDHRRPLAPAFMKRALAAEDPAKSVTDDFAELEISSSVLQRIFGVNVPRAKKLQGLSKAMRRRAFNAVNPHLRDGRPERCPGEGQSLLRRMSCRE